MFSIIEREREQNNENKKVFHLLRHRARYEKKGKFSKVENDDDDNNNNGARYI